MKWNWPPLQRCRKRGRRAEEGRAADGHQPMAIEVAPAKRTKRGRTKRSASKALLTELFESAQELTEQAYAESSQRVVKTALRAFVEFDEIYADERQAIVRPAFHGDGAASLHNELTLMLFAAWLLHHGLAVTTITCYVSLVRTNLGVRMGFAITDKGMELRLPRMLKGLRRMHKVIRRKRLGWRARYERQLQSLLGRPACLASWTQAALRRTLRQGLMRGADCLPEKNFDKARHATLDDLKFFAEPRPHLRMTVQPAKKSEQQGKSEYVYLPEGDGVTDAYTAIIEMLKAREVKWGDEPGDTPLFVFDSGAHYKVAHARALFKMSGKAIGIDPNELGAQSARIGGATDSFNAKGTPAELQIMGRWVRSRIEPPSPTRAC